MSKAVAVYLRLSQEDIDLHSNAAKDESNSISAQRNLIVQHIEQTPELAILPRLEFCDDGFTGTNFNRPQFQRMIELAKMGEIGCIVVKDLSRFGRDYLEVGDYLEHIFPFLGIRFQSVNDHYDSLLHTGKTAGMDVTFRNLVYDYYSKDLSSKVKSAMRLRQQKGEFLTSVTYGYTQSPDNRHKMVIDEPAAVIVREIFDAVIAGQSTSEIAASLNARGVPTPQMYKGIRRRAASQPQWTHTCIAGMIRNIKYTGVMTNHTRESRYIRDKSQRKVPREEWILHPGAHPAIISQEKWEKANACLRSPKKVRKNMQEQPDRIYYCAHCGRKLRKTYGLDEYYSCVSAQYQQESKCAGIHLKRREMEEILLAALKVQINFVRQSERSDKKHFVSPADQYKRKVDQLEKELAQLQTGKMQRYEAYRSGKISREDFIREKECVTQQSDILKQKKQQLETKYQSFLNASQTSAQLQQDCKQAEKIVADYDAGLRSHLYEAIKRVIVTNNTEIQIEWNFADLFAAKAVGKIEHN